MKSLNSKNLLGLFLLMALSTLGSACSLLGGVRVESIAATAQKPSNVALFVHVRDGDTAVPGLTPANFKVYENGQLVSADQTRLTLLPQESAAARAALLLVDLSGTTAEIERYDLARAVGTFVQRVRETEDVVVYGFAGSGKLSLIGEYPKAQSSVAPELTRLSSASSHDASRDLTGSVLEGLKQLDRRLKSSWRPLRLGALVVFARGPDLTGRVSASELDDALDDTGNSVFVIVTEGQPNIGDVEQIGRSGVIRAPNPEGSKAAFEEAARRVTAEPRGDYLVSYCSPARAGERSVRLEVEFSQADGKSASGSVDFDFDANGFSAGCDPKSLPRFPPPKAKASGVKASGTPATPAPEPSEETVVPPPDKPGYVQ